MMDLSSLIHALESGDAELQQSAAEQLAQAGPEAQAAAVALVSACATDDDQAREWLAAALEDLGPPPAKDLPQLVTLLAHPSLDVGYWAATLLGRLEGAAAPAVDALADALGRRPEMAVQQRIAWALGKIGPAAGAARGALQQAAAGSDRRLASLAGEALERLGTSPG